MAVARLSLVCTFAYLVLKTAPSMQVCDHHFAQINLTKTLTNEHRYSQYVRPVHDDETTTKVRLSFQLGTVIDLDEASQTLVSHIGLTMTWNDEYLSWDKNSNCNVSHLRMSSDDVWLPDITLSNSAEKTRIMDSTVVSVDEDGLVTWSGLIIVKTFCKIDFSYFPYDEQKCSLTFRPWTHVHAHIKMLNGEPPERINDDNNGEWVIEKIIATPTTEYHDHGNFSKIDVEIHLSRQPLFYFLNMIIPCVLIYGLTLLSFCLPGESGEKIALNVTILLSLTVFMLLSAEMMPPSSDTIPVIAQFYSATIVLVSISIFMAVMSLNFYHRPPDASRAPAWLRKLFLKYLKPVIFPWSIPCGHSRDSADLSRIMDCNGDVVSPMTLSTYRAHGVPSSPKLPAAAIRRLANHTETCGVPDTTLPGSDGDVTYPDNGGKPSNKVVGAVCATCNSAIRRQLVTISEDVHAIVEHRQEDDDKDATYAEWKKIAHAFDRFGLLLFILATVILAIILSNELSKNTPD